MKDINFSDTIQFGIWKYLDEVNGVVVPQYSCAQPITNGVRLGNGNDTIAGVGECGVTPPLISCEGAVTSIVFPELSGVWDIELDGSYYDAAEREIVFWLQSAWDATFNTQKTGSVVNIANIDTGDHRFKLIPVHSTSFQTPTGNITFIEHEDGSLTFCLSPAI